jgi:dTDP-4-amino-4,6-dideoxy-D-galactose acyltransferase
MKSEFRLEPLAWDTEFFGIKIGRLAVPDRFDPLALSAVLEQGRDQGFACLYLEATFDFPDLLRFCARRGFYLVASKATFEKTPLAEADPAQDPDIILARPERYYPDLEAISDALSLNSRFRYDPRFRENGALRLYREWLRRSFREDFCSDFLTAVVDGRAAGFLTLRDRDSVSFIDLVAVATWAQGRGLGGRLLRVAEGRTRAAGQDRLRVVTQGHNLGAVRFYQSNGFRTIGETPFFHIWLEDLD